MLTPPRRYRSGRDAPRFEIGAVVPEGNPRASLIEGKVRAGLEKAGFSLHPAGSAIQCDQDSVAGNFPVLTPDVVLDGPKVVVEVDSEFTHGLEWEKDESRNRLLKAQGWTVVRLRLGGLSAIGAYDVTTDAAEPTAASVSAVVDAVRDAAAGSEPQLRHVAKVKRAPSTKPKSKLGAIAPHSYVENAFYAAWSSERLVLMDGGNYLAVPEGHGAPQFLRWTGLAQRPRKVWRDALTEILGSMTKFKPVSLFPWGDDIIVGDQADQVHIYRKFNLGGTSWDATANLQGSAAFTGTEFLDEDGAVLAKLHDGAIDSGWRIAEVTNSTGYRGPYQRVRLERSDERGGLWRATA